MLDHITADDHPRRRPRRVPGRLQPDRLNRAGSRGVLPIVSDPAWIALATPSDLPKGTRPCFNRIPTSRKDTPCISQRPRVVYTLAAERQRDLRAQAMRAHLKQLALQAQPPPKSRAP